MNLDKVCKMYFYKKNRMYLLFLHVMKWIKAVKTKKAKPMKIWVIQTNLVDVLHIGL